MKRIAFLPLAALLSIGVFSATTCYGQTAAPAKAAKSATLTVPAKPAATGDVIRTDVIVGTGAEATSGKTVSVHYTGWLYDAAAPGHRGIQIDNSSDRGTPFEFTLGAGQVIEGWDQGMEGMKVGGRRTLLIPGLGYTTRSAGGVPIPPNTALVFDIDLLAVR